MSEGLVERIDLVRGDVSRGEFVRGVVERALGSSELSSPDTSSRAGGASPPASAEQPGVDPGAAIDVLRELERPLSRTELFRRAGEKR